MARVVALLPDLLFGSKVAAQLGAAGHDVAMVNGPDAIREQLEGSDLLIVDLCSDDLDGTEVVGELTADGELDAIPVLGFFRHTEPDVRERALAAGFAQVVPRSRMAREAAD